MRKYGGSEFSGNRFKKKGFSGHRVNPGHGVVRQAKEAGEERLPNKVRHHIRRAQRAHLKGAQSGRN